MTNFENATELLDHIGNCLAAKTLLPLIYQIWGDNDNTGHPLAHFIQTLHKNVWLIKKYAYSVADGISTFERSKIHRELCEELNIKYNEFLPFEDDNIKKLPTRNECEEILWHALFKYGMKLIKQQPVRAVSLQRGTNPPPSGG